MTRRASPPLLLLLLLLGPLAQALVTSAPRQSSPSAAGSSRLGAASEHAGAPQPSSAASRRHGRPDDLPSLLAGQAVYVIEFETEDSGAAQRGRALKDESDGGEAQSPLDPWSIVWYIGSFGGLIAFFLVVSCSEWCCRRGARPAGAAYAQRAEAARAPGSESPPPPYHLFAPPPYDSVGYAEEHRPEAKEPARPPDVKLAVYVIGLPA